MKSIKSIMAAVLGAFLMTSAAHAGTATFTGNASAGFTQSPQIFAGQFTTFTTYSSAFTWRYVMHTFTVDQTGPYNATSTTGPDVNTTYILTGTFAPNTSTPTTPLSNFVVGAFSGGTTATLTNVTLTAGQQYTALVVYNNPAPQGQLNTFTITGPGNISCSSCVAPVPTMSEWAMILFGVLLAGGAAVFIQRRRFQV
ncbi:MAG: IPTL-CTERM sorting domain-containing protein [Caulobacterales bacterium]|nr:IPTL-CTERM sorting domain-containing protein [Caulobacterales bacterium]